eukprot:3348972-Amphidinium_carterae.1
MFTSQHIGVGVTCHSAMWARIGVVAQSDLVHKSMHLAICKEALHHRKNSVQNSLLHHITLANLRRIESNAAATGITCIAPLLGH